MVVIHFPATATASFVDTPIDEERALVKSTWYPLLARYLGLPVSRLTSMVNKFDYASGCHMTQYYSAEEIEERRCLDTVADVVSVYHMMRESESVLPGLLTEDNVERFVFMMLLLNVQIHRSERTEIAARTQARELGMATKPQQVAFDAEYFRLFYALLSKGTAFRIYTHPERFQEAQSTLRSGVEYGHPTKVVDGNQGASVLTSLTNVKNLMARSRTCSDAEAAGVFESPMRPCLGQRNSSPATGPAYFETSAPISPSPSASPAVERSPSTASSSDSDNGERSQAGGSERKRRRQSGGPPQVAIPCRSRASSSAASSSASSSSPQKEDLKGAASAVSAAIEGSGPGSTQSVFQLSFKRLRLFA